MPARTAATKSFSGAAMGSSGSTHVPPPTSSKSARAAEPAGEMAKTGRPACRYSNTLLDMLSGRRPFTSSSALAARW